MNRISFTSLLLLFLAPISQGEDIRDIVIPCNESKKQKTVLITSDNINGLKWGATEESVSKTLGKPSGYLRWGHNSAFIYGSSLLLRFEDKRLNGTMLGKQVMDYQIANEMEQYDLWNTWSWEIKDVMSAGSSIDSLIDIMPKNWSGTEYEKVYSDSNFTITPSIVSYGNSTKRQVGGIMLIRKNSKNK